MVIQNPGKKIFVNTLCKGLLFQAKVVVLEKKSDAENLDEVFYGEEGDKF